ncbi:MAG: hypothetical protein AB8E82_04700 [Aureispira sp.]
MHQVLSGLLGAICLIGSFSVHAQQAATIKQALGLDIGVGLSGEMDIENHSPSAVYIPHASTAVGISYHALLFQQQLHLAVGLGYQSKESTRDYGNLMDNLGASSFSDTQHALMLPVELGYQWAITPKHSLLVDALAIPFWSTLAMSRADPGDSPITYTSYNGGVNIDFGLQLGYQLHLNPHWSGQIAVRGTVSPFNASTHDNLTVVSTEYYTLRLHLGLHYTIGQKAL